jgi:E3 ubiquitin-protein ligase NEDD4
LEIKCLLCGDEYLSAEMIIQNMEFYGFPTESQTPTLLKQVLQTLNVQELRKFLLFITEYSSIPAGGFARLDGVNGTRNIVVKKSGESQSLLQSHTCFLALDLPPYDSFDVLNQKLLLAIEEVSYQNA